VKRRVELAVDQQDLSLGPLELISGGGWRNLHTTASVSMAVVRKECHTRVKAAGGGIQKTACRSDQQLYSGIVVGHAVCCLSFTDLSCPKVCWCVMVTEKLSKSNVARKFF